MLLGFGVNWDLMLCVTEVLAKFQQNSLGTHSQKPESVWLGHAGFQTMSKLTPQCIWWSSADVPSFVNVPYPTPSLQCFLYFLSLAVTCFSLIHSFYQAFLLPLFCKASRSTYIQKQCWEEKLPQMCCSLERVWAMAAFWGAMSRLRCIREIQMMTLFSHMHKKTPYQ